MLNFPVYKLDLTFNFLAQVLKCLIRRIFLQLVYAKNTCAELLTRKKPRFLPLYEIGNPVFQERLLNFLLSGKVAHLAPFQLIVYFYFLICCLQTVKPPLYVSPYKSIIIDSQVTHYIIYCVILCARVLTSKKLRISSVAGIRPSSIAGIRPIKMQSGKIVCKQTFSHLPFWHCSLLSRIL